MRFLLIAMLLWPSGVLAQNHFMGKQFVVGSPGGIEYPLNTSGVFNTTGAEFYFDFTQDPSSSPVTDGTGNYQFVVSATPQRLYDGTYPDGIGATMGQMWYTNSTSDGLSRADDDALDLTTIHTYVFISTPGILGNVYARKISSGPSMGYKFFTSGTSVAYESVNTTATTLAVSNSALVGRINCAVVTVDGTAGVGSSTGHLYVDEYAKNTSTSYNPVGNAAAPTTIQATGGAWGNLHFAAYFPNTEWTEAKARSFCRKFYGMYADSGQDYVSITSASPAATMLTSTSGAGMLVSTSADTAIIGEHGFYAHPAIDNLVQRSSFETWPTWDETETAGDGSCTIDSNITPSPHGYRCIKWDMAGTTSVGIIHSACVTSGISSDLYLQYWAKKSYGTTELAARIHEYSDASCSSTLGTTDIVSAENLTTSWAEKGALWAAASWNGSTSSWKIEFIETCDGCGTYVDAVQAVSRSVPTDSYCVTCDTDATCSCTYTAATIPQALSAQGWRLTATIRSPIDGASASPVRYVMTVPGTAGNNNRIDIYWDSDTLTADVYDSSGTKKTATVAAAGSADTDYDIEVSHTTAGVVTACWEGSCGTPATGATMDGISATCRLGHNGASGGDVWIRNLKVEAL